MDPGAEGSTLVDVGRFEATRMESRTLRRISEAARARARATRGQVHRGRSHREKLHDSAFARLRARMESMPVIEQAKGILMAQLSCGPEEAFDLLRQVSQRTNIKLHVLAALIVEHVAASKNRGNVTHISVGAARYLRSGTRARPHTG
ncbi:MAG TPA: ANTAR domain-containing protein [Streptosporangiaceae bacterium]|nr:ANTAR domain-containing protein [Streptosporangiaceae bacterium]